MQSYDNLIMLKLQGDTPKKKYEFLTGMQKLLQQIAYPRRGTEEEQWNIQDVADKAQYLVEPDANYDG